MKIYVVKTFIEEPGDVYSDYDSIRDIEYKYFSSKYKAELFLIKEGYYYSPILVMCGDKVIRVFRTMEETNESLSHNFTDFHIRNFFHIDQDCYKNIWVDPICLLHKNYYDAIVHLASITEAELL